MPDIPADETRIERKRRTLRQQIITAAVDLFENQGFANTTMEQIAAAADVARKTLYNYFPVKEAIAEAYVRGISQGYAQETLPTLQELPDTRTRLLTTLNKAYGWVENNPELAGIVIRYRMGLVNKATCSEQEATGTQKAMAEIIRQGQDDGEIRTDIAVPLLIRYIDIMRATITLDWLQDPDKFVLQEEMAKLVDLLLNGASTHRK